jgi:hypothetical protein
MTENEFLEFWKNIQWPKIKPVYYRLYYDNAGLPLFYSQEDLPGKYIDVTPEQFAMQDQSVKIIDGKLVRQRRTRITKLVHRDSGTLCHVKDVSIVVDQQPGQYWKKQENVVETN